MGVETSVPDVGVETLPLPSTEVEGDGIGVAAELEADWNVGIYVTVKTVSGAPTLLEVGLYGVLSVSVEPPLTTTGVAKELSLAPANVVVGVEATMVLVRYTAEIDMDVLELGE